MPELTHARKRSTKAVSRLLAPSAPSPCLGIAALRSKWVAGPAMAGRDEGAYPNRYVTEEQRSRRPIFIATLRATRLLAGCRASSQNTLRRRYTSHGLGALDSNS